jgi:hypothetical protein
MLQLLLFKLLFTLFTEHIIHKGVGNKSFTGAPPGSSLLASDVAVAEESPQLKQVINGVYDLKWRP